MRIDQLPAAYEFLRTLPTFRRLPHADTVRFEVGVDPSVYGKCYARPPHIIVSAAKHRHITSWLATLAHEMVHLRLAVDGCEAWDAHGPDFKRHAERVCRAFGWDSEVF